MPRRASTPPRKAPAFQFFARDWIASTIGMAHDVAGVYIKLLALSWDAGGALPDDAAWRRTVLGPDAPRLWRAIRGKWIKTRNGWINRRLEQQRAELAAFTNRAKRGAAARWKSPKHDARPMLRRSSADCSLLSADLNKPASPARVPFRVYAAIATQAIHDEPSNDLGAIAERFKTLCAQQRKPYDAGITQKAIDAARRLGRR